MKKNIFLIIILLLLAAIAFYFIGNDSDSSINIADRDFVVENEEDIAYITLNIKNYPLIHLQKEEDSDKWILNDKYYANPNIISNLTGVMSKMTIKYIPPKTMNKTILSDIEEIGIEVRSYDKKGKTLSHFIVGANDNKEISTFCLKKGAKQPYAMHVSVAEGGLRNYFAQTQIDLRDKSIFDVDSEDITAVKMSYKRNVTESFSIDLQEDKWVLKDYFGEERPQANQRVLEAYIKEFNSVASEAIRTGDVSMDSIRQYLPFATLEFDLKPDQKYQFDFYPVLDVVDSKEATNSLEDIRNNQIERYFVYSNYGDVFLVQHRLLKAFFRPIDYFQS